MTLVDELQYFFLNGSITDFAVAVIFGQTFATVISSLVEQIVIPTASALIYKINVEDLYFNVRGIDVNYGGFINNFTTFVITMLIVFFIFIRPFKNIIEVNKQREDLQTTKAVKSLENIEMMLSNSSQRLRL